MIPKIGKTYAKNNLDRIILKWIGWSQKVSGGKARTLLTYRHLSEKWFKRYLELRVHLTRKASMPFFDFYVTTRCTLKCKECHHFNSHYKQEAHHDCTFEEFKADLDRMLANVDLIFYMQLMGGEPLLNKELARMVEYARTKRQILHLAIVTNCTIPFPQELTAALKKNKSSSVIVSNYSYNPEVADICKPVEIVECLRKNGIPYMDYGIDSEWRTIQKIFPDHRSVSQIALEFGRCILKDYKSVCDGKMFGCPAALYVYRNLKEYIFDEGDSLNIRTEKNLSGRIIDFYNKPDFSVCECCHYKDANKPCIPAEQMTRRIWRTMPGET